MRLDSYLSEKNSNFAAQSVEMSYLEQFKIDLKRLAEGDNVLEYDLDDTYFEAIGAPVVRRGKLRCTLDIHCVGSLFDINFHTKGSVVIPCDICLDDMEQAVDTRDHLTAKLGEGSSDDDNLVFIAENEGILDVAWYIYEFIELSIPLRHVHAPGKCNPAMMKVLEEHSAARSGVGDGDKAVDSRWEALSKIKITE